MNAAVAVATMTRGLRPLSGRVLLAYRIGWALLAAVTVAILLVVFLQETMQPLVLGLRLFKSAILIAVAAVLLRKRPRDPVAAILALAFLCWTITSSVDFTSAEVLPMLLDRLRFLLFALALLLFPDGKWRPRWTPAVAVASANVFLLGVVETLGLLPTRLFLPLAIACILLAIGSLVRRFRSSSDDVERQQLKWIALGLVGGVGLILTARAGAALEGPALAFEALFQLGIVLVALGFLVPLLRYRLYDAETVISRSAAYAVLTAALVGTFAGTEALIETLGQRYLGAGIGQASSAAAAAVAAILLTPLHQRISNWAEQHFQRDLVQLKNELPDLLSEIPASWSQKQIGAMVLPRIVEAIHATRAALVAGNAVVATEGIDASEVKRSRDRLLPVQLALRCPFSGTRGWLLLGRRPDGSLYGQDEREALAAVLPPLRRALLLAQERQRDRRYDRRVRGEVVRRINSFDRRLSALERQITTEPSEARHEPRPVRPPSRSKQRVPG